MSQFKSIASATFGQHGRYQLEVAISRFNKPVFFVKDAAVLDNGMSAVIRQADSIDVLDGVTAEVDQEQEPFKGLRPQPGDVLVNLGRQVCKFKRVHHSGGWLVQLLDTNQSVVVNPEFTRVIRNDGRSCPEWD